MVFHSEIMDRSGSRRESSLMVELVGQLKVTEDLQENWKRWYQKFTNYLIASEKHKKPDIIKTATLLHLIGDDGLDIYNQFKWDSTADKNNFQLVVDKFSQYFSGMKNVLYERCRFFKCKRQKNQSVDNYVSELKNIAMNCEFDNQNEKLIRDQLVLSVEDESVQETIFSEGIVSLKKVIELVKTAEACMDHQNIQITQVWRVIKEEVIDDVFKLDEPTVSVTEKNGETYIENDTMAEESTSYLSSASTHLELPDAESTAIDNSNPPNETVPPAQNPALRRSRRKIKNTTRFKKDQIISNIARQIKAQKMKPACIDCRYQCSHKFSNEQRMVIHQSFSKMNGIKKCEFLSTTVEMIHSRRRKQKLNQKNYNAFYLDLNGERSRVCKEFFMRTLGIHREFISFVSRRKGNFLPMNNNDARKKGCDKLKLKKQADTNAKPCENEKENLNTRNDSEGKTIIEEPVTKDGVTDYLDCGFVAPPVNDDSEIVAKISSVINALDLKKQLYKLFCYYCVYKTCSRKKLKKHIILTHMWSKASIDVTIEDNNIVNNLDKHDHDGNNCLVCKFCNYSALNTRNLSLHMSVHVGEKQYFCKVCDYRAARRSTLDSHLLRHSNNKLRHLLCRECPFSTTTEVELKSHMIRRHSVKVYKCDYCNYVARNVYFLKKHLTTLHSHLSSTNIQRGVRKHKKRAVFSAKKRANKPHQCTECSFIAAEGHDLRKHMMRKHANEKPFSCDQCYYRAATSYHLRRHFKNIHYKLENNESQKQGRPRDYGDIDITHFLSVQLHESSS